MLLLLVHTSWSAAPEAILAGQVHTCQSAKFSGVQSADELPTTTSVDHVC